MTMDRSKYIVAILFIFQILFFAAARDVGFLLIGLMIWWFAFKYRTYTSSGVFLSYCIGLMFLYPQTFPKGLNFHNFRFVLGVFCICFYLLNQRQIHLELGKNRIIKKIILFWLVWSTLSYAPVFVSNLGIDYFPFNLIYNKDLAIQTTLLKTTFAQFSVIVILIPILALKETGDFQKFFKAIFIAASVVVFMGFIRYFTGMKFILPEHLLDQKRFIAFSMSDPNGYARLMLLPVILSFSHILAKGGRSIAIFCFLVSILSSVVLTFSRGGLLATLLGILVVSILHSFDRKTVKPALIIFAVVGLFWFGSGLFKNAYEQNYDRLSSMTHFEGRVLLQQKAIEIISESPFFGAHPGHSQQKMQEKLSFLGKHSSFASAHNIFLQTSIDWGSPLGFVLIICLLLSLRYGLKARSALKKHELYLHNGIYILNTIVYVVLGVTITYMAYSIFDTLPLYFIFLQLGLSIATFNLVSTQVRLSRIPSSTKDKLSVQIK